MSLSAGARLGPYEVLSRAGAGGMGEVYRALDTRLQRHVALKVLTGIGAGDAAARERFEREARLVASLNHPHVCALFDVGHDAGVDYLVLEYLEGETLHDHLTHVPGHRLPLERALAIGIEIAGALEVAHRASVIHRDLKPGNVMLTKTGTKLLDFGLAKAVPPTAGVDRGDVTAATVSAPLTGQGTILGTLQYMAPEQLEGREADQRTDIFALGAVIYEMLSGQRAFQAQTQASLIAAIISSQPPSLTSTAPLTPPLLEHVVRTCLAKAPEARWQSATDVIHELRWLQQHGLESSGAAARVGRSRDRKATFATLAAAALAVVAAGGWLARRPSPPVPTRVSIDLPGWRLMGPGGFPRISPDGRAVVFVAPDSAGVLKLWIRSLDQDEPRALSGTEGPWQTFWAPDSRSIGFFTAAKLKRVDLSGGAPIDLADVDDPRGGAWGPDGTIVFAANSSGPLMAVSASGGPVRQLTTIDASKFESGHRLPHFLPDGRRILYVARSNDYTQSGVYVTSLDGTAPPRRVLDLHAEAIADRFGHLLYVRGGVLTSQQFDAASLTVTGDPLPVSPRVAYQPGNGGSAFSIADNGTLAYITGAEDSTVIEEFAPTGSTLARVVGAEPEVENDADPELSPDDSKLAVTRLTPQGDRDIWIIDRQRKTSTRLTSSPFQDYNPVWSPDGTRVAYFSNRGGVGAIYAKSLDGPEEMLYTSNPSPFPYSWSPDGKYLLFGTTEGLEDLFVLPLDGDRRPAPYLVSPFVETMPEISPDGRMVAYVSSETGRPEVYLQTFPSPGRKVRVSTDGGVSPRWSRDGRTLFFARAATSSDVWSVPVGDPGSLTIGEPHRVLERASVQGVGRAGSGAKHSFAVTRDGHIIAMVRPPQQLSPPMRLILNWPAMLQRQ